MRIGLSLPHYGHSFPDGELTWPAVLDAARRAETLGFDSIWISDHFFLDLERYGAPAGLVGSLEPFTALAGLATATERVRLGTLVACAPFRHPAHVAKMATAIDLASGGRFDLGIGAGWYEREFRSFGYDFPSAGERFARLEDDVSAIAALFEGKPVDMQTERLSLSGAYNRPVPAREGGPPIWIGGKAGDRLLGIVARLGVGWNTVWRWTPEEHGERANALRRMVEGGGRDPSGVRMSVGLYCLVGEDERDLVARYRALQRWAPGGALDGEMLEDYARDSLTGTPEMVLERLARFSANGVEEMILAPASVPFAVFDWSMLDVIAEAILPAARSL